MDIKKETDTLSIWVVMLFLGILIIGLLGFKYIVGLSLIDAFQNTAFYMSGLGSDTKMITVEQKLFASVYALISTLLYLGIMVYIIVRIIGLDFFKSS